VPWTRTGDTTWETELPEGWFGPGLVRHDIVLHDDRLDLRLEVEATDGPIPATLGWHPWFRREVGGSQLQVDLPAAWMLERDGHYIASERQVPVPPLPWDDAFGGISWPITLTWPDVLTLEIDSDGPVAVVYTPNHAICVEPQSGPPDEVNLAEPTLAEPGQPVTLASTWRWR
jgi:aldose 1-epimerase